VQLNANLPALSPDGTPSATGYNEIEVQAASTNTGNLYICVPLASGSFAAGGSPPDTTNFTNVIAVIPPGSTWPRYGNPAYADKWNLSDYWLGAGNATDYAFGCAGKM
jgi:hypothetical protein